MKNTIIILCVAVFTFIFASYFVFGVKVTPQITKEQKNITEAKVNTSNTNSVEEKTPSVVPPVTINFYAMGDISLGSFFGQRIRFDSVYEKNGPEFFLKNLQPYLKSTDFNVANLESVFTDSKSYLPGKIYSYKVRSKEYAKILSTSNIMYLNVVNNHMQDYKQAGFDESNQFLTQNNFKIFGTNLMPTNDPELGAVTVDKTQIFEKDGFKIGMLGFYAFVSSYATDDVIQQRVAKLKSQGADFIFAYMHGGGQETYDVYQAQVVNAHRMIDNGVDLVLGMHPHALQKTEYYKDKKIYYSLGNFFFPNYNSSSFPETIMVKISLTKDSAGKVTAKYENVPVLWTGIYGGNNFQPAVIGSEKIKTKIRNILHDTDPVL
ncbi:CapA family protein [Criibacterium bergeronii]|nr:CapA family protein [Criibacterium bergeronii]MBS6063965.1 CapA family protein [Peptostreptococcaceae bacterium]